MCVKTGRSPGLNHRMVTPSQVSLVVIRKHTQQLQWRDRAGIAPDFPIKHVHLFPHLYLIICEITPRNTLKRQFLYIP